MASQAASISMEYMKKFLAELGRVFPEKKSFLDKHISVIEHHLAQLESMNKRLLVQLEELQMRQGTHRAEKQGEIKQLRKENETIRLPIAGSTTPDNDDDAERPRHIISKTPDEIACIRAAMKGDGVLRKLSEAQLTALINEFEEMTVQPNTTIVSEGSQTHNDRLFIVKNGTCAVVQATTNMYGGLGLQTLHGMRKVVKRLKRGELFGEIALFYSCKRTATVKTEDSVVLWSLKRTDFKRVLATIGTNTLQEKIDLVKKCAQFGAFTNLHLKKVAQCFAEEYFQSGSTVIKEGDVGSRFYIIKSGTASVRKGEAELAVLGSGESFGEISLLGNKARNADVIAVTNLVVFVLNKKMFISLIGSVEKAKAQKRGSPSFSAVNQVFANTIEKRFVLTDMMIVKQLGKGAYGTVQLVSTKELSGTHLALKCIPKCKIVETKSQKYAYREKAIVEQLKSQFCIQLFKTFKDAKFVYFLTDAYLGGTLFDLIKSRGQLTEDDAIYYAACVTEALAYIHDLNIVHRDLKPDNLLLNDRGCLVLVDFGFAKEVEQKAWTFCGTPEYIAPEIILHCGHDISVDYWSFGVLIYEMLTGTTPFRDINNQQIYQRIANGIDMAKFVFVEINTNTKKEVNENAVDLIKSLCKRSPTSRLGYQKGGLNDIRTHKWFTNFSWEALIQGHLTGPYLRSTDDQLKANINSKRVADYGAAYPAETSGWDDEF